MLVSVVVPAFNRADQLGNALRSIQAQTYEPLEILVVDDASTDDTLRVVQNFGDPRIEYIRHAERRNAAAARNTGIRHARGKYVAFLDSDDEWLPGHLSRKVRLLQDTGVQGVFGSFYLAWTGLTSEYRCADLPRGMPMAEYILSSRAGDARTSTFVFEAAALQQVMFDGSLEKHQDWDLAIRFAESFSLLCDRETTVVIHPEADGRMSHRMRHAATQEFLRRYSSSLTPRTRARVYADLARKTLQAEGRNRYFGEYLKEAIRHWRAAEARDKMIMASLLFPGIDRIAVGAGVRYARWRRLSSRLDLPTVRSGGTAERGTC